MEQKTPVTKDNQNDGYDDIPLFRPHSHAAINIQVNGRLRDDIKGPLTFGRRD